MMHRHASRWIVMSVVAVILTAAGVQWRNAVSPDTTAPSVSAPLQTSSATDATAWLDALRASEPEQALRLANGLVSSHDASTVSPVPPSFIAMARRNGIEPVFFSLPLNDFDAQGWMRARFFQTRAADILTQAPPQTPKVRALFDAVTARLAPRDPAGEAGPLWPERIWRAKAGLCDRQAWVLCELAYQAGCETQIVYLRQPETLVSPHTICEIHDGTRFWIADPFSRQLLRDTTLSDLIRNPGRVQRLWPDRADWWPAVAEAVYWVPAMPCDYRPRNQALHRVLSARLNAACPRFGDPPDKRLQRYRARQSEAGRAIPMQPWFYPFRLLRLQGTRPPSSQ